VTSTGFDWPIACCSVSRASSCFYEHASKLQLETVVGMHPANTDCPTCQKKGRVPMHGGLRDKECPRCGGRSRLGQIAGPVSFSTIRRVSSSRRLTRSVEKHESGIAQRRRIEPSASWKSAATSSPSASSVSATPLTQKAAVQVE